MKLSGAASAAPLPVRIDSLPYERFFVFTFFSCMFTYICVE